MVSALAQSIPQEEARAWAFGVLLILATGLFGLLTLGWIISRHRIQQLRRDRRSKPETTDTDIWTEAARRIDADESNGRSDRD